MMMTINTLSAPGSWKSQSVKSVRTQFVKSLCYYCDNVTSPLTQNLDCLLQVVSFTNSTERKSLSDVDSRRTVPGRHAWLSVKKKKRTGVGKSGVEKEQEDCQAFPARIHGTLHLSGGCELTFSPSSKGLTYYFTSTDSHIFWSNFAENF